MFDHTPNCDVENMLKVRKAILNPDNPFSMATWGYCISGWAITLSGVDKPYTDCIGKAANYLGLSEDVARELFMAEPRATRERAALAIENIIQTGNPNWYKI